MMQVRQLPLPFPASEAPVARAAFFAAASNQSARAWLERPGTWPDGRLLLCGPAGVGKSHLLARWAEASGAALLAGAALRWPRAVGAAIALDDADLAPETGLLHLLNHAAERGATVLLAARAAPSGWALRLPDLASRLRAATAVAIEPAEDSLLRAVLARACADRQMIVTEAVQDWLRAQLPRTPAAMAEAAARLDHAALAAGGRVSRALAGAVVDEMAAMWHPEAS